MEAIELHDALLKKIEIDIMSSTVVIYIEYYHYAINNSRIPARITLSGVSSITGLLNLHSINKNSWAGNINYFAQASSDSPFYLYLVEGCIAICAESVDLVQEK
ncbi:hypothetical protein [Methylosinus sp. sav-2]|uniref:hypothetical protein n=1 Tax=Methylosinus sp. sav-2 TaxID=2485168 RepID=UPI001065164C|nr:hypothetical protein [Methylosinus sp. sav-2]